MFFQLNEFFYAKVNRNCCRKFRKSCCSHRTELKKLSFRPSWVCKQITIPIGNLVVSINHINTSCFRGDLMSESFSILKNCAKSLSWTFPPLKAYVSEEILSWHSLSADLCIHFYCLSQLRQASQRKIIQSSALRLRLWLGLCQFKNLFR